MSMSTMYKEAKCSLGKGLKEVNEPKEVTATLGTINFIA
jgi:hypothetical protein